MMRRVPAFLLGLTVASLGYANWRVIQLDLDSTPVAVGELPSEALLIPALNPPPEPRPLSEFAEIVRRPLFSPGRLPHQAPEQVVAEVSTPGLPKVRLLGVVLDEDTRRALLRVPEHSEQWVREGEEIGGWRLESVSAEWVVVVSGERIEELPLYPALVSPPATDRAERRASFGVETASGKAE
jgi:hypothetical protein